MKGRETNQYMATILLMRMVSLGILFAIDIKNRNNDKLPRHAEQSNTAADIIEEILPLHLVADVAINI